MPVNNTEPLSIYRAGPGYAKCLADMILAASRAPHKRGYLDHLLHGAATDEVLRLLAALAVHPRQQWGRLDNTWMALVDGVCAGTATFRPAAQVEEFPFSPPALLLAASGLGLERVAAEALDRQRMLLDALPSGQVPPPGTWRLDYLGVRYENRGAGVGRGLMLRALDEVRAAGGRALELYCQGGNDRAAGLFAALGFREVWRHQLRPGPDAPPREMRLLRLEW